MKDIKFKNTKVCVCLIVEELIFGDNTVPENFINMTLKPPGSHMEATPRMKAVYDMAAGVSINHDTHPKHYFRSGRELIRSAASYQEDGQTEHAYVLYIRFLT